MKLRTPPSREGFGQSYVICRGEVVRVGWAGEVPRTTPRVISRHRFSSSLLRTILPLRGVGGSANHLQSPLEPSHIPLWLLFCPSELGQENCHSYSSHTYQQPSFQPSYMPYAHLLQHTHYITGSLLISIYISHNIGINILLCLSIAILISICYNIATRLRKAPRQRTRSNREAAEPGT